MQLLNLLLGRPLATREQSEQRIGVVAGVAALGLDGLSSAAYGPEALLTVLTSKRSRVYYVGPITVATGCSAHDPTSYRQDDRRLSRRRRKFTRSPRRTRDDVATKAAGLDAFDQILTGGGGRIPAGTRVCLRIGSSITLVLIRDAHRHCAGNLRGTVESGWAGSQRLTYFIVFWAVVRWVSAQARPVRQG